MDTIKNNKYSNGQVEDLISENNRRQQKNRGRDDRGDSNIQIPHQPPKRRKYQFSKRKSSNDSSVPKRDESSVLGKASKIEQKDTGLNIINSQSSESSTQNLKFFTIFSKLRKITFHQRQKFPSRARVNLECLGELIRVTPPTL